MRIIAYQTEVNLGSVLLKESTGETRRSNEFYELACFLLEQYEDTIKVCWNLNETVAPILKTMGEKVCTRLAKNKRCYFAPFNIFYVPDKVLSIVHIPSKQKVNLYGIDQYFPDVNKEMNTVEIAAMGEYLLQELGKMRLYPKKLTSPIAIYEECVLSYTNLPTKEDMPIEAAELAYLCSGKLWIEAYKLGFWETAYDYDIESSFPGEIAKLIDFRECKWYHQKEYIPEAIYGYTDNKTTIFDWAKVHPIIHINKDGSSDTAVGTRPNQSTKKEIEFVDKWEIGEIEIYDGWWCVHNNPEQLARPMENLIARLLKYKARDGLQGMLSKRMSVGVYGKFGEDRKDKVGPHFNPCWFAEVSTNVRLEVADFIYRNKVQDDVIHASVDGVLLERKL